MNWLIIKEYIFGTMTFEFVVSFYLYAVLGMSLTLLLHLGSAMTKSSRKKEKFIFKIKYWFRDNWIRVLTNLIVIFIIIRFYDSLSLQYQLDMFLGFVVGLSIDTIIIFIREKTKFNLFQSKFNT